MSDETLDIISLLSLRKRHGKKEVLSIESLRIRSGDRILFWGANASGKSSLIRILFGLSRPSTGRLERSRAFQSARRLLLPQQGGLYDDLTVRQNLLVLSQLHGYRPETVPFDVLLGEDREAILDSRLGSLSGGMQRVVTIAALFSINPQYLFLDEPFLGLDEDRCSRVKQLFDAFTGRLELLIVSDHYPERVDAGWRKLRLVGGRIAEPA